MTKTDTQPPHTPVAHDTRPPRPHPESRGESSSCDITSRRGAGVRYAKMDRVFDLMVELRARRYGMTLEEIEAHCDVGHRTAQRLRDLVQRTFPEVQETVGDDRKKRWHLPVAVATIFPTYTADELADMEAAIKLLDRENMRSHAKNLRSVLAKVRATLPDVAHHRIETDIEALMEAEGLAARPGPKPVISADVLGTLRMAVKACCPVHIVHRNRQTKRRKGRTIHPYGFLFGMRHYLVAHDPRAEGNRFRLFSMANIEQARLEETSFVRDPEFDIRAFARASFGVFQEEAYDVVWRFPRDLADAASEFVFHPDEVKELEADGSLRVSFRSGGLLEMAWHLNTWGSAVDVLSPPELAALRTGLPERWAATP